MKLPFKKIYILGNDPQKDWQIILVFSVILTVAVSAVSGIFYIRSNQAAEISSGMQMVGDQSGQMDQTGRASSTVSTAIEKSQDIDVSRLILLYQTRAFLNNALIAGLPEVKIESTSTASSTVSLLGATSTIKNTTSVGKDTKK